MDYVCYKDHSTKTDHEEQTPGNNMRHAPADHVTNQNPRYNETNKSDNAFDCKIHLDSPVKQLLTFKRVVYVHRNAIDYDSYQKP